MWHGNELLWILVLPWWSVDHLLFWMSRAFKMNFSHQGFCEPQLMDVHKCSYFYSWLTPRPKTKGGQDCYSSQFFFLPSFLCNVSLGVSWLIIVSYECSLGIRCTRVGLHISWNKVWNVARAGISSGTVSWTLLVFVDS